jgi:hypothetical protein
MRSFVGMGVIDGGLDHTVLRQRKGRVAHPSAIELLLPAFSVTWVAATRVFLLECGASLVMRL